MKGNTIQGSLDATVTDTGWTVQNIESQGTSGPLVRSVVGEDSSQTTGGDDGEAGEEAGVRPGPHRQVGADKEAGVQPGHY